MIRPLTFIFFFLSLTTMALGQALLKGQVTDAETGDPLEYATVSLLQPEDSTLVNGGSTDEEGKFSIETKPGQYVVKIQFVSYQPKILGTVEVGSQPQDLGSISLDPATSTLSEVLVEGRREQTVLELDKRTFNVSQDLSNTGRNADEILDNLPSITVDVDGNVSLRGSGNVRILVDGKPSGLVGISSANGLRSLSGDMIERIEVVTNPSARYDAQGSAGIINIILKKEKKSGLNGSFTANAGQPDNYGGSVNLNYRRSWMNFFVNYGINYRNTPGSGSSYQEFNFPDTSYITLRDQARNRGGLSNNIRIGTDFILNKYNTLTTSFLYRVSDQTNTSSLWYHDYTSSNELLQRTLRTDEEDEDEKNQEYELYYKRTFDQKERELTATVQYRESGEIENSDLTEYTGIEEQVPSLFQRSLNDENERQWLMQADYIHPFLEKAKFETGYRGTLRQIDNQYLVEEQEETGLWSPLSEFSNTFRYNENIHALYAIASNKTGKWSYQGGLRVEATDITTHLIETDDKNNKDYVNFFPSAFLTYALTETNSLQASYSRRINRPRFWSLNPFFTFSDARNIRSGNPDLDPEFTDSYELGYLHNFSSGNIYAGGYYRLTNGVTERVSRVEEDGITYSRPENLSTRNSFGIEVNTNQDLFSWWQLNGNFNFYRAITEGEAYGLALSSDTYTMSGRVTSKWNIPKLFQVQLSGFYRAPEERPQGRTKAFYSIDLGATRDILNKKGTLSLNARDLLNSRKFRFETFGENFYQESTFQWRARQITLSFTYRLNQNNKGRQQRGRGQDNGGGGEDMEF